MTEDMELMFANPLNGFSTYYTSYAHIYMDEATSLKVTDMRRTRWIKGYVAAKRIYTPELKMDLKSPKDKLERYFLTGMYPVFVMYGITVAFFFISLIWSIVLFGQQEMANAYLALANAGYAFLFAYVTLFILTAFCLIVDRKYIKCSVWKKIAILFAHPLFYMGYFYISLEALFFHKEEKWEPVERTVALEEK
jgi:fatty acid desaturase